MWYFIIIVTAVTVGYHYFTFHKWHVAVTVFSSDIIVLGIMWVRTKNSERLIESYNTLRNDALDTFMHCSCGWIFRTKRNEWHRKLRIWGKLIEVSLRLKHINFLWWLHVHFVTYNRTFSIVTTRNTRQQVASKMFCSDLCCGDGKGPNKNEWQNIFHCVCVFSDVQFWISVCRQSWYSMWALCLVNS